MHLIFVGKDNIMCYFRKLKWKALMLFFAILLLAGCDDLIIKDDGQVAVGLEDCEGVFFNLYVRQSGKVLGPITAEVEDGMLEFDVRKEKLDFDKPINIELWAIGTGAQACGIAYRDPLVFNGTADPVGIRDHKISLSDFKKK